MANVFFSILVLSLSHEPVGSAPSDWYGLRRPWCKYHKTLPLEQNAFFQYASPCYACGPTVGTDHTESCPPRLQSGQTVRSHKLQVFISDFNTVYFGTLHETIAGDLSEWIPLCNFFHNEHIDKRLVQCAPFLCVCLSLLDGTVFRRRNNSLCLEHWSVLVSFQGCCIHHKIILPQVLLEYSMSSSLMLLHIVATLEDFEALRTLSWLDVHMLHANVTWKVDFCN